MLSGSGPKPKITRYNFECDEEKAPSFISHIYMTLEGTSPLLMHRFGAKARKIMLDRQTGASASKRSKSPKDPESDFCESLHVIGKTPSSFKAACKAVIGIPAVAVKAALIRGAKHHGVNMTDARTLFTVASDGFSDDGDGLIAISEHSDPEVNERAVSIKGTTDIRIRPLIRTWLAYVRIDFDAQKIPPHDLVAWARFAGQFVGLLEGRPGGKNSSGTYGCFRVTEAVADVVEPADADKKIS